MEQSTDFKDRTAAAESIVAAEERERAPVWKYAQEAVDILGGFLPPPVATAVKCFVGLQDRRIENLQYLHEALRGDVRDIQVQVQNLSAEQEKFYREEFLALVVDAHFKAEALRSKSKIQRIARILVHSLERGPKDPSDYTEEMMRVATVLDDNDVEVLRQIVSTQKGLLGNKGYLDLNEANRIWKEHPPNISGLNQAEITSICSKLESFGLIVKVERNNSLYGLETVGLPFALLRKGVDFVSFAFKEGKA